MSKIIEIGDLYLSPDLDAFYVCQEVVLMSGDRIKDNWLRSCFQLGDNSGNMVYLGNIAGWGN